MYLHLQGSTIITSFASFIIMFALLIANIQITKYLVTLGMTMFAYVCLNVIIPNNDKILFLGVCFVFVYVYLSYDNIVKHDYFLSLGLLLVSIFGILLFINSFDLNFIYSTSINGFLILLDKLKILITNLLIH